ncbi:unnamed protein product [Bursaphelenchus xylophilus]|nr:unnamed protein product [Bursaphelenchus xylophilus]CAG9117577.1 unnamed protein product [Bursaphelenchus xylophilus]
MFAGYFGNALVIWATFHNRKLQGSCNCFMAFGCFADIIHMSAHWVYVYTTVVTGENFIPYDQCLFYQAIPFIFVTVSIIMTLFVGIDRLVSVTFPLTYGKTNKNLIVIGGIVISILCALYFVVVSVIYSHTAAGKNPVLCAVVNAAGGRAFFDWFYFCVLVNLIDLIIYTTVWVILLLKSGISEESKKVFRSLFVVMLTVAFGWLANAFVHVVIIPAFVSVEYQYEVTFLFGIPVNLASSGTFVTLYIFSQEYRQTFRKLLGFNLPESRSSSMIFTQRSKTDVPIKVATVSKRRIGDSHR